MLFPTCQVRVSRFCQSCFLLLVQIECQNIYIYSIYPIYTCRWCVRNDVQIMCQGGGHSKKALLQTTRGTFFISSVSLIMYSGPFILLPTGQFHTSLLLHGWFLCWLKCCANQFARSLEAVFCRLDQTLLVDDRPCKS